MTTLESESRNDKDDNGKKLPSKLAGIPVSDIKAALKEIRVSKGEQYWSGMSARHFSRALEKKFKLDEGKLKHVDLSTLIDQVEDETREEEKREKAKKRRDDEKKKKKIKRKRRKNRSLPQRRTTVINVEEKVHRKKKLLRRKLNTILRPNPIVNRKEKPKTNIKKLKEIPMIQLY